MGERLAVRVECYSGHRGEATPRRVMFDGRAVEVREVIDRWYGPAERYFKLRGDDGAVYIIRHQEQWDDWDLVVFDSGGHEATRLSST